MCVSDFQNREAIHNCDLKKRKQSTFKKMSDVFLRFLINDITFCSLKSSKRTEKRSRRSHKINIRAKIRGQKLCNASNRKLCTLM